MCLYFSHDANAHRHRKMRKLRGELGWRGYGLYWAIVEILREERDYRLPTDYKALKVVLDAPAKLIERVVTEFDLFTVDEEDGYFYSQGLNERMERVYNNRHSQQEEEEPPSDDKPKYTMSDAAREARKKGGRVTKSDSEVTKSELNQEQKTTKSEQKITKSDSEVTKSELNQEQKTTKSEQNPSKMGGRGVKDKRKNINRKEEYTPPYPPRGKGMGAGGQEISGEDCQEDWEYEPPQMQEQYDRNIAAALHKDLEDDDEASKAMRLMQQMQIGATTIDRVCALYEKHCEKLAPLSPYDRYMVKEIAHATRALGEDGIEQLFSKAGQAPLLRGEVTSWRADLRWLLKPENYRKVLSGNYDHRQQPPVAAPQTCGVSMPMDSDTLESLRRRFEANIIQPTSDE